MNYLEQRHPLYFMSPNLKKEQIRRLVEKIQFKLKPSVPIKTRQDLSALQKPEFKSGAALPSVVDKENKHKVKFQEDIDDYDEEGSDFDANELMDMSDYKNKRGIPSVADIANIKPNIQNAKQKV